MPYVAGNRLPPPDDKVRPPQGGLPCSPQAAARRQDSSRERLSPVRVGVVSHEDVLVLNTGTTHGIESWEEGRARQAVLCEQTRRIADVLEASGIQVRLPSDVSLVGEVTGNVDLAESWRAIRFLPLVAQRDRKPVSSAMKLWLRGSGGRHVRYAVVTSGDRVPLGGALKKRQAEHTANIRRWASEAGQRFGVELLLRATEYTVNDDGVHLHSNIAYRLARPLPADSWSEFLSWSRGRLQATWKDCGELENADELVKYCVKPADLDRLGDDDLVWLFEQTFRAKMIQPLGAFGEWMKDLERDRLKVAMVRDSEGNKSRLRLVTKMKRDMTKGGGEVGENVICGRTLPQARWTQWAEPVSLVMGYTEMPQTPEGVRRLAVLRSRQAEAQGWWIANGAPDPATIKVHTDSPTVQNQEATKTVTASDGTVFDPETGEVLYEHDPGCRAAQEGSRIQARQAHEQVTVETTERLAEWHAGAPERAAWAQVVANEQLFVRQGVRGNPRASWRV